MEVMQVICSQMDFTHLQSNFFLSLAKNGSAKHFFFLFCHDMHNPTVLYIILLSPAAYPSILS